MRMWNRHPGFQPHHRADGRLLILLLLALVMLGSLCTAQAEEPLRGVYNPDVPPPLAPEPLAAIPLSVSMRVTTLGTSWK